MRYVVYTLEGVFRSSELTTEIMEKIWHRTDGAAFIEYDDDGKLLNEHYFLNNMNFSKDEFTVKVFELKLDLL